MNSKNSKNKINVNNLNVKISVNLKIVKLKQKLMNKIKKR